MVAQGITSNELISFNFFFSNSHKQSNVLKTYYF